MFTKEQKDLLMIKKLQNCGYKPFSVATVKATGQKVTIVGNPERYENYLTILVRDVENSIITDYKIIELEI